MKTYFNCIKGCSLETRLSVVKIQYICSPTEEQGRERGSTAVLLLNEPKKTSIISSKKFSQFSFSGQAGTLHLLLIIFS
jgi:hypothetical protein